MCGSPEPAVVALGRREVTAGLALPRRRGIKRQNGESHDLTLTAVFFLPDSGGGGLVHMKEPSLLLAAEFPMRGSHGRVMLKMLLRTQAHREFLAVQHGPGIFFAVRARMTFVRGCLVSPTSLTALAGAAILLLAALLATWPRLPAEPVCKCRSTT
jgi:hypothetical protein